MGIAAVIPRKEFRSGALTDAIKKLLSDSDYLERSQKVSYRLQKIDGVTGAVTQIEQFLEKCAVLTDILRRKSGNE